MIKKTTFYFFIFISLSLNAQNWQCFKTDGISHFKSSHGYIASVRIDSTYIENDYSDFISYYMVRDGQNAQFTSRGSSWIGEKFRLMNSGKNYLYNALSEQILIKKPVLNDSYQMFRSDISNIIISATVDTILEESFLGLIDSVAQISMIVSDTLGNNIVNPCNNYVIRLSKNYGLITALNFYTFPFLNTSGFYEYPTDTLSLIGMDNPQIGWQNLTAKDIYDWEVGDEFHTYENHTPALPPGASDFSSQKQLIRKILSKNLSSDSVSYLVERCSYSEITHYNPYQKEKLKTKDTIIEKYAFNNPINMLPYEYDLSSIFNFYLKTETEIHDRSSFYFVNSQNNECHEVIFTNVFDYTYIKELGITYYDDNSANGEAINKNFVYYKKGNLEWGTPYNCETLSIPNIKNNDFKIYPNPTKDKIYLEFEKEQIGILKLYLTDLSGKEILRLNSKDKLSEIDLSTFENGIYMLNFETENENYFYKISKQ